MTAAWSRSARRLLLAGAQVLVMACGGSGEQPRAAHQPPGEDREALDVSPAVRDAIRAEMRAMLGSLNAILTALGARDTAAMAEAAQRSGLGGAADLAFENVLPAPFLKLGIGTHTRFDSLAAALRGGIPADSVAARLAGITDNCVACHSTYRLEVR